MVEEESMFGRLGKCEVCNAKDAKYTCPRCEVKTCCLSCVNIHKKELECDGIRNKVSFIPLSKFTNLDLLSDYRLLEETTRSVDKYKRDKSKRYTTQVLPLNLYKFRGAAKVRGIDLHFLPPSFTRGKENTSFYSWTERLIYWRVDWIFPQAGNIKCVGNRLLETEKLSKLMNEYLDPKLCDPLYEDKLQYYQSAGISGVVLLLKAEKRPGERFHELDTCQTLKENLKGKTVIEFPTIYVILKDHRHAFDILGPDEEAQYDDEEANPNKNNPFFNASDLSDSEEDKEEKPVEMEPPRKKRKYKRLNIPSYDVLIKQSR